MLLFSGNGVARHNTDGLKLLVRDVASSTEQLLDDATMEAVLEARETKASHTNATRRLTLDEAAGGDKLEHGFI